MLHNVENSRLNCFRNFDRHYQNTINIKKLNCDCIQFHFPRDHFVLCDSFNSARGWFADFFVHKQICLII